MLNVAFEIGFDHYRFALPLDIARFSDSHRQQIRYGYQAASLQKVTQKKPDRYENKLLTLRDRALTKGLDVTLTVNNLRDKLQQTHGCCPITGNPFTFAEHNATDWSVDRVDNTRGYCLDNIEIVSVTANQAKSDLDLSGIIKQALGKTKTDGVLSEDEWFRMARFYYKRMTLVKPLSVCRILADSQPLYDQVVFMQLFKNDEKRAKAFLQKLQKYSSKEAVTKASKLTQKRVYHRADIYVDVLYDSPKLYRWVQAFIKSINAHSTEFDLLLMDCLFA